MDIYLITFIFTPNSVTPNYVFDTWTEYDRDENEEGFQEKLKEAYDVAAHDSDIREVRVVKEHVGDIMDLRPA